MTQLQLMRLLFPVIRMASWLTRREAYMVAFTWSMWIFGRTWCLRDPVRWWKLQRQLRLLRRGVWEIRA